MLQIFVKPALCAALCGLTAFAVNSVMPKETFTVLIAIFAAVLVYAFCIFKGGTINGEDIIQLPKGDKLCGILKRIKLIK